MNSRTLSLIFLPTLQCNAACDYCFETRHDVSLQLPQLRILIEKVFDYLEQRHMDSLRMHWQGGEVMTLSPQWFEQAYQLIQDVADTRHKSVQHLMQSNLIGYSEKWNPIIATMFGNNIGSSLDFPNLHRKTLAGHADTFTQRWVDKLRRAHAAGIDVQVIAIPNEETLQVGAEAFYHYFVDELGITSFQVNTPFPGGEPTAIKSGYPLPTEALVQFLIDLADIWFAKGYSQGVTIGPFDGLFAAFNQTGGITPCIWRPNCVDEFICIDANGYVAQCDCWVSSYADYRFGNLLAADNLADLLHASASRHQLQNRPIQLMMQTDCVECDYLALCHGGCPVRAYTVAGTLMAKDPYCAVYKALFSYMQKQVSRLAQLA